MPEKHQEEIQISRRYFIKKAGLFLIGSICAGCSIENQSLGQITQTAFQPLTATPKPSAIPPTSTPTFSPDQLSALVSKEEIAFLIEHEVKKGDSDRPVVLLTYDDNAKYADVRTILDALSRYHAKATFFFIGEKVILSSKAVRAIVEDGHVLGCHGYEHIDYQQLSDDQINRQIENSFKAIQEVVPGYRMKFIRFPFGNGIGDQRLVKIAAEWGLQNIYWTMGSGGLDSETYDNVIRNVQNGSIVLSHMFRPFDVLQADKIIGELTEMGFSLETVETGRKKTDIFV